MSNVHRCLCGMCTVPCERPPQQRPVTLIVGASASLVRIPATQFEASNLTHHDARNRAARRASMFKRGRR